MPRCVRPLVLLALTLLALAACSPPRQADAPVAQRSREDLTVLLVDIRAFEARIGFQPTRNFTSYADDRESFPFCGHVGRLHLPYSYEDPAIVWSEVSDEEQCMAYAGAEDVLYTETEAVGEAESPITPTMLAAPLPRLLYLIVHEDCHDQFELPQGIEEALCNVISFRALTMIAAEKYTRAPAEHAAIHRFVRESIDRAHATVSLYARLAALYALHASRKLDGEALLERRAALFRAAEREIDWPKDSMNNVWVANSMTYSRHYAAIDAVFDALGGDLARGIAFFRRVDRLKIAPEKLMAARRLSTERSVEFLRAYEEAVLRTTREALAAEGAAAKR